MNNQEIKQQFAEGKLSAGHLALMLYKLFYCNADTKESARRMHAHATQVGAVYHWFSEATLDEIAKGKAQTYTLKIEYVSTGLPAIQFATDCSVELKQAYAELGL